MRGRHSIRCLLGDRNREFSCQILFSMGQGIITTVAIKPDLDGSLKRNLSATTMPEKITSDLQLAPKDFSNLI